MKEADSIGGVVTFSTCSLEFKGRSLATGLKDKKMNKYTHLTNRPINVNPLTWSTNEAIDQRDAEE